MPEVKFCGMTRVEDARLGAELGARYVGVIFAQSPRRVNADRAREIAAAAKAAGARAFGVFGDSPANEVVDLATAVGLDGVQLHGDSDVRTVESLRRSFHDEIWAVARINGRGLPPNALGLADAADGLLLDTGSPTLLGGTGATFDWERVAEEIEAVRGRARLIVAGGLRAENVARAIAALSPDVVDVSSGIESAPGVKDHDRMRAFMDVVRGTGAR